MLLESGGRVRVFGIGRLTLNLNARVYAYFLQRPIAGSLYRITLANGNVFVGQVEAFSSDPNDDIQELILRDYSVLKEDRNLAPVSDAREMLIPRDAIATLERLIYQIPTGSNGPSRPATR